MPPRAILLIPRHPPRRTQDPNTTRLRAAQKPGFTFDKSLARVFPFPSGPSLRRLFCPHGLCDLAARKIDTPILDISFCALHRALNSRDEVEVAIKRRFGG